MKLEPIKRIKVSDQVFLQLKQQILAGEWKEGDKIPSENELAATFAVSRITVRQALSQLSSMGLLETRLGEGSFVKKADMSNAISRMIPLAYLSATDVREVLEFRQAVEVETAGIAAEKVTDAEIEELRAIYEEMILYQNEAERFAQADLEFHFKIAEITKNSLIIETQSILKDILGVTMKGIVGALGNRIGLYYHERLIEVLATRDAPAAKALMLEHIKKTAELMLK